MPKPDPVTLAFDKMLNELYAAALKEEKSKSHSLGTPGENAAHAVCFVIHSFNWDRDKYLSDQDYAVLEARYSDTPSRLRLIAFMREHLDPTPNKGIVGLAALLERLQIKDATSILSRIPQIAL